MGGTPGPARRAARWLGRHKGWTAVFAAVLVVAVAVTAGAGRAPKRAPLSQGGLQSMLTPTESPLGASSPPPSTLQSKSPTPSTVTQAAASGCRAGDPLANVYHPDRLDVRIACITVSGVVTSVRHEDDGDYHFNVRLDAQYEHLINAANEQDEGGALVAEIVPADEPGCVVGRPPKPASGSYDYGVCTGADIARPAVGDRVTVTGPYVLDTVHGWMEVHPVWKVAEGTGSTQTAPAPPVGATVRIVSISPNPVNPGEYETLAAHGPADAACNLTVTYASGHVSSASGLGAASTDGDGNVSWTWKVGSSTGAGTATADVSCGSLSARGTFDVT